ncbi:ABC transporter ATP-binding protein [Mucilaginibacter koreensis]
MIELINVTQIFNAGRANEVKAIHQLNLHINAGEYVVVVGANGSGKSTLLNLIAGNIRPSGGEIIIEGNEVNRLQDFQRSRWVARVFQNPLSSTAPELTILENFRLAALRVKHKGLSVGTNTKFKQEVQERIATLGMGLENKTDQLMGSLSGGQRQALTLLMSVMADCKILLLDEPSAALDPRSAQIVMQTADELIKKFNLTAILITHNLKDAFTYGNRLLHMQDGVIIKDLSHDQKSVLTQNDLFLWFS